MKTYPPTDEKVRSNKINIMGLFGTNTQTVANDCQWRPKYGRCFSEHTLMGSNFCVLCGIHNDEFVTNCFKKLFRQICTKTYRNSAHTGGPKPRSVKFKYKVKKFSVEIWKTIEKQFSESIWI